MKHLRDKIKCALEERGILQDDFANAIGYSQSALSKFLSGGTETSIRIARQWPEVAAFLHIPEHEMRRVLRLDGYDPDRRRNIPVAVAENIMRLNGDSHEEREDQRQVPVYGLAAAGEDGVYYFNGEVLGYADCPPALLGVQDAYAVIIDGDSMYPRYKSGETVWVDPGAAPARGNDVVVQLAPEKAGDPPRGFIKEYRGRSPGKLWLAQYKPEKEIEIDQDDVVSVHPIVFAERF